MREIKFKYVMKAKDRIKISKPFTLEQIDDISCMFEEVAESFLDDCKDIGHTQSTCECFDDFWNEGEITNRLQFTGLLDKQGIEIYEGDIAKFDVVRFDKYFNEISRGNHTAEFYFCDSFMQWRLKGSYNSNVGKGIENIEIVGNIHENKELLEKK